MPATRTGASSRRVRGGAITQRRMMTTVVIVASARPPYRPELLSSMSGRLVEKRMLSAVAPIARIATRDPVDVASRACRSDRQGSRATRMTRGRVFERQGDLADERDPGEVEGPDEPGEPDEGHQPAGAVGRFVIPDRQPAVQVGQPDRKVEQSRSSPACRRSSRSPRRRRPTACPGRRSQHGANVRSSRRLWHTVDRPAEQG